MIGISSRRTLLKMASIIVPMGAAALPIKLLGFSDESAEASSSAGVISPEIGTPDGSSLIGDIFPTQPAQLVREMVTVAHYDLQRVQELVGARPSLARAAWDWGFGDWETALGASSHMGNRLIAEYLISKGARPSLFSAAMLGQLNVVTAFVSAQPGVQRIRGPHSIDLLAHAKAGGDAARPVFEFLQSLGDAGADPLVPLSDGEAAAMAGTYIFGVGASEQIDVTVDRRQGIMSMYSPLTWTRKGTMGRPLLYVGNHAFYPAGVPSVRIRFTEEKNGVVMTVNDPDLVLTARQKQESK
jgi:hypothetical protein